MVASWFCLGWVLHPKLWRWQRRSRAIVRGLGSRGGRPRGEAGDEVMGGRLRSAMAGKLGLHTDLQPSSRIVWRLTQSLLLMAPEPVAPTGGD